MKHNLGTFLLRFTFGFIMLVSHGIPKLLDFSSLMNHFPSPLGLGSSLSLGLAIFAEVLCAFLIAVGLFTRLAAIPLIITMVVAILVVHAGHPWSKVEPATMYLLGYVAIFALGPGSWSLDSLLRKKS